MKKIYLVYKCTYNAVGEMTDNLVVNVFSNAKKAENYKKFRYKYEGKEHQYYYIVPMYVENFDYGGE